MFVPPHFFSILNLLCFRAHNETSAVFLICMLRTNILCDPLPFLPSILFNSFSSPTLYQLYSPKYWEVDWHWIISSPRNSNNVKWNTNATVYSIGVHTFSMCVADRLLLGKLTVFHSVKTFRYCSSLCSQESQINPIHTILSCFFNFIDTKPHHSTVWYAKTAWR